MLYCRHVPTLYTRHYLVSLVADTFPKRRHGLVLGLMSLTYPVGTAAALIVVSLIGAENWRQPFIIYGVIGMVLGSDATELRWSFGGAVLLMFSLDVVVCLAQLRTVRRDMARSRRGSARTRVKGKPVRRNRASDVGRL